MSGTQYVRKLATAAAVSLALTSGGAFGLGLGDIEMRSALNQPMQAEIRLTAVKPGELDGMVVQLASADAFARAGIERSTVLTDLSFSVDNSGSVPVIRISSNRAVVEPFLNFLLEVDWPQGRMIREYTVLLDPPVFMTSSATNRNTAGDQAVVVQRGEEALVVPTPIDRNAAFDGELVELGVISPSDGEIVDLQVLAGGQQFDDQTFQVDGYNSSAEGEVVSLSDLSAPNTSATQSRNQRAQGAIESVDGFEVEVLGGTSEVSNDSTGFASEGDGSTIVSLKDLNPASTASTGGDSVSVQRGDTLYEIARSSAVGGASIQQMMMALLKANESSFINGNINLVKAGSTLTVPSASEATQLSQAEALSAISEQNTLWRDYRDQLRGNSSTRLASTPTTNTTSSLATPPLQEVELLVEGDANTTGSIADRAQAIIDSTRDEIREREELKLVADSSSASTATSATVDETSSSETNLAGEVNRKLQLAREELASTRLQSSDLSDQASELLSTSENLDSLVELRQTGVANLEAQLADARKNSENAVEGLGAMNEAAGDSSVNLLADASNATSETVDSGTNALTEAGESLGQVELFSENGEQQPQGQSLRTDNPLNGQAEVQTPPPSQQTAWYQNLLSQPLKLLIAASAVLGTLGLGALLLWRRRRADDVEDVEFDDDVDFIDDDEAAALQAELNQDRFDDIDDFGEVGTAPVANTDFDEYDSLDATNAGVHADFDGRDDDMQDLESDTGAKVAAGAVAVAGTAGAASSEALERDDTISEVDVYLNYGLHGQAEELLNNAVENQPNNPAYARKLLETYHGQGSGEKYLSAAKNFHARFGGESNPDWNGIATEGAELLPNEPLFQNAVAQINMQQSGFGNDAAKLTDDDFLPASESASSSINRSIDATNNVDYPADLEEGNSGFDLNTPVVAAGAAAAAGFATFKSEAADAVDFDGDETDLMDQSLDPAFAFDEADLEATGDFSQIANELAAEAGESIDFPSFDDTAAVSGNTESFLDATIADPDGLSDAFTMDEIDGVIGSADDLTLDLDQLSGDLELDSAELMNPDLSDIDLPELSFTDDLGAGDIAARAVNNDSDAMETMLDLAKAYIDMGDKDSASSALDEIVKSGNPAQVTEAETLLRNIS